MRKRHSRGRNPGSQLPAPTAPSAQLACSESFLDSPQTRGLPTAPPNEELLHFLPVLRTQHGAADRTFQVNGSKSKPGSKGLSFMEEAAHFISTQALSFPKASTHITLHLKTFYLAIG